MEALLGADPPMQRESWQRLKSWYKGVDDRVPPPASATLKLITAEQVDLYSYVPYPEKNIPLSVKLFLVDDLVPTEDEIEEAVNNLRRNRSGEPSRMRAKHLKGWLAASKRRKREAAEEGEGKLDDEEGEPTEPQLVRFHGSLFPP